MKRGGDDRDGDGERERRVSEMANESNGMNESARE